MAIALIETEDIVLAEIESRDITEAQGVFDQTPRFHRLLHGKPADPDMARRCFEKKPPKPRHGLRVWKHFLGVFPVGSEEMIGAIDLFVGYPSYDIATIATFLLRESHQRKGHGSAAMKAMVQWLRKRHPAVLCADITLTDDNIPATRFLLSQHFQRTNDWDRIEIGGVDKRVIRLERLLKKSRG